MVCLLWYYLIIFVFLTDRFCYMEPFGRCCEIPEEKVDGGLITLSTKRSGYDYSDSRESEG